MTKAELITKVMEKAELSKKDSEKAVNAFFATVKESLAKGEKIGVVGFGTFEVRNRSERKGHNPKTGETITIPATKAPAFKASKSLKEAVNA